MPINTTTFYRDHGRAMKTQSESSTESIDQPTLFDSRSAAIINSVDALPMIDHGRELSIGIVTPVGSSFRIKSNFIGTHSNHMILVELPKLSDDNLNTFVQDGFWATLRATSPRGEGAVFSFRSQILHVIKTPIAMVAMSIPQTMQSTPLRNEPRYEVNLQAKVHSSNHRIECVIRDLSKSGCLYITPTLTRPFISGEEIELHIRVPGKQSSFESLSGTICNVKQSSQKRLYGVKFDQRGKQNAKTLLAHLKFDGNRLELR